MVGIDLKVMCHHLKIDPKVKRVRQKRHHVSGERAQALKEEIDRLLNIGLIKESFCPEWLANPVLVKKPNRRWRNCVDFTDLNKACLKDSFPLPRIDQLMDATIGHTLLSFMDAYSELVDEETRSTNMEKLVYAIVLAARKVRPYFQAHKIEVRTAYPLWKKVLVTIESHIEEHLEKEQIPESWWTLYIGEAVNHDGVGDGIILESPEGHQLMSVTHFTWKSTNNDAEYEALISVLKLSLEMKIENIIVRSDSMLVVHQVIGGFQARGPRTKIYLRYLQGLIRKFREVRIEYIPREENSNHDALEKWGSQKEATLLGVISLEIQEKPSISSVKFMQVECSPEESWMTPICEYLKHRTLLKDRMTARKLRYKAARYVEYDFQLYKRGFNQP
ncbi:uncharacterized protein LOC141665807 [Apium graveolens]|uniref:uncharacterized protein LOC141665807 n=1 Tax=Apium graveolens TaxID=4045 RepID=UPI003D7B4ED4